MKKIIFYFWFSFSSLCFCQSSYKPPTEVMNLFVFSVSRFLNRDFKINIDVTLNDIVTSLTNNKFDLKFEKGDNNEIIMRTEKIDKVSGNLNKIVFVFRIQSNENEINYIDEEYGEYYFPDYFLLLYRIYANGKDLNANEIEKVAQSLATEERKMNLSMKKKRQKEKLFYTAFYCINTKEKLIEGGIIGKGWPYSDDNSIGIYRIYKKKKFESENDTRIDKRFFTRIKTNETLELEFPKDYTILSEHSKEFLREINRTDRIIKFEITNPMEFWRNSKILIVISN